VNQRPDRFHFDLAAITGRRINNDPSLAHAEAMARGADCPSCPLFGCRRGPVMGVIVPGAKLAVVGEAPGSSEVDIGIPFSGRSGQALDAALLVGGLQREQVTITNSCLCQPPEEMQSYLFKLARRHKKKCEKAKEKGTPPPPPLVLPTHACAKRLQRDLTETAGPGRRLPPVVLAVGGTALSTFAHAEGIPYGNVKVPPGTIRLGSISKQQGAPVVLKDTTLIATYHPAFAMREGSRQFKPIIEATIAKAARIAKRDGKVNWTKPEYLINPGAETAVNFLVWVRQKAIEKKIAVTIDIETDGLAHRPKIRCVGVGITVDGHEYVCVVPFNHVSGAPWWPDTNTRDYVARALAALLNDVPLVGQNLSFDTLRLLNYNVMSDRRKLFFDDMIAHHDSMWSELPHDLGFMVAQFTEAPRHKEDAESKSFDGLVTDEMLHRYNADDVLTTMRLAPILAYETARAGQTGAFETDTKLAPVARDMEALGLVYDHDRRLKIFLHLRTLRTRYLEQLREAVGRPDFNPGSTAHVRDWLFGDLDLTPVLGTDGEPWMDLGYDEDDEEADEQADPSTSEHALQAIVTSGVDKKVEAAIELLLRWRGVDKLRGTYCGLREPKSDDDLKKARAKRKYEYVIPGTGIKVIDTSRVQWEQTRYGLLPILHVNWKIHSVNTGRWSSSPNIQNWPSNVLLDCLACAGRGGSCPSCYDEKKKRSTGKVKINMRSMIVAPPGHKIVGSDAEQIELRIYCLLANDKKLGQAFLSGEDPHSLNFADLLFGTDPAAAAAEYAHLKELIRTVGKHHPEVEFKRLVAKRVVYLVTYGGDEVTCYATMSTDRKPDGTRTFPDVTQEETRLHLQNWHAKHPETKIWQDGAVRKYRRAGYAESLIDFRKRFFVGGLDRNAVINFGVQSTAAALMNRSMLKIAGEFPYRGLSEMSGPQLQIHDYLSVVVPDAHAQRAKEFMAREMPSQIDWMPFPVDVPHISQNLADQ
jgi:DNA polymerase